MLNDLIALEVIAIGSYLIGVAIGFFSGRTTAKPTMEVTIHPKEGCDILV